MPLQDSHSVSGWGNGVVPGCLSHPPPRGCLQGVCPIPPPPGDASRVFAPPPPGCLQGVCPIPPPPGMPPGCLSHPSLSPPLPSSPLNPPPPPGDAEICAAAPPPPPPPHRHGTHPVFSHLWYVAYPPHTPCPQPPVCDGQPSEGPAIHPTESSLSRLARSLGAHCAVSRAH